MATAPPTFFDPSQIQFSMATPVPLPPPPPPVPTASKSRVLDILKVLAGFLIALILAAILAVLIFVPRTTNGIDLRESNEKIAKLQRESNENIARLQREQQLLLDNQHQKREENLTEIHRLQDRLIEERRRDQDLLLSIKRQERQENLTELHRAQDRFIEDTRREQDLSVAMEQSRHQFEIEERRLAILLQERQSNEQHRKEDKSKENDILLSDFMQDVMSGQQPVQITIPFILKVQSLIRRFDPPHKTFLITFLYQLKLLNTENPSLDLQGADLKELSLNDIDSASGQVGPVLNYNQLSLPSTNLINSSFEQIYLNEANFSSCNLMGASFRSSEVVRTDFTRAKLSLADFRFTNASQSNFSSATIQRAHFQGANLSQSNMDYADLGSTGFQNTVAIQTNFSHAEMSNADFQYSDLFQARLDMASARSVNFYEIKAIEANFTQAYMPGCQFQWADLTSASFRNAFLAGTSFADANVQNVDFSNAYLQGAIITQGQLDVALSISKAILPDSSIGKNKNLVGNGNADCAEINSTILDWSHNGNVFVSKDGSSNECVFQAKVINATLQQSINIRRFERWIQQGRSKVYIEMQGKVNGNSDPSTPPVYMNVRFLDSANAVIGPEESSLNTIQFSSPSTYIATVPCPSTTVQLELTVVFRQATATVDNIYITIE